MTLVLEDSLVLEEIPVEGYEKVFKVTDPRTRLKAIICLHSTKLGPTLGGTRMHPYATFEEALTDVKRLSRGMTYKSAMADCGWGGGKSVIIGDAKKDKTPELLESFAKAVNRLKGIYICAEDVGCTPADMKIIGSFTPYVSGLPNPKSSGNPSPFTAWGVYRGIQAVLKKLYGDESVKGRTVAIQGLGSVGSSLAEYLFWHGAKLILCDIDKQKTEMFAKQYCAQVCGLDEILFAECDVLAPCALGGIINSQTIPRLRCKAVAGAANNQLLRDTDGDELLRRNILYAPDFVINAGGLINVTEELEPQGYNPVASRNKVDEIYDKLLLIFDISSRNHISTSAAAMSLCDYRLKYGIGRRVIPPHFHHFSKKSS